MGRDRKRSIIPPFMSTAMAMAVVAPNRVASTSIVGMR